MHTLMHIRTLTHIHILIPILILILVLIPIHLMPSILPIHLASVTARITLMHKIAKGDPRMRNTHNHSSIATVRLLIEHNLILRLKSTERGLNTKGSTMARGKNTEQNRNRGHLPLFMRTDPRKCRFIRKRKPRRKCKLILILNLNLKIQLNREGWNRPKVQLDPIPFHSHLRLESGLGILYCCIIYFAYEL
jgi:hypothetical protein